MYPISQSYPILILLCFQSSEPSPVFGTSWFRKLFCVSMIWNVFSWYYPSITERKRPGLIAIAQFCTEKFKNIHFYKRHILVMQPYGIDLNRFIVLVCHILARNFIKIILLTNQDRFELEGDYNVRNW